MHCAVPSQFQLQKGCFVVHSRIFQVSKGPIAPEELLSKLSIPEYFTSGIADYLDEVDDRDGELDYFIESEQGILEAGAEHHTFRLAQQGRENYFRDKYKQFQELCARIMKATLEDFIGREPRPWDQRFSFLMYQLNDAYCDRYGYYIFEDEELMPYCEWMRGADPEAVYYLGNVLDYHF